MKGNRSAALETTVTDTARMSRLGHAVKWSAVCVAVLAATACGGTSEPQATPPPSATPTPTATTFIAYGSLTTPSAESQMGPGGDCEAGDGYTDISTGADVEVQDASGKAVALGELEAGTQSAYGICKFSFQVQDVPEGESIYKVKIGNDARGAVAQRRESMESMQLSLG